MGTGTMPAHDRAQEREDELVGVGDDDRETIALLQPVGVQGRGPSLGLTAELGPRAEALRSVRTHEDEPARPGILELSELADGRRQRRRNELRILHGAAAPSTF